MHPPQTANTDTLLPRPAADARARSGPAAPAPGRTLEQRAREYADVAAASSAIARERLGAAHVAAARGDREAALYLLEQR